MSPDDIEKLIKKLLTQGVTVILISLGPAGQLVGATPGTPSPSDGGQRTEAPDTRERPPLEATPGDRPETGTRIRPDGTGSTGSGSTGSGSTGSDSTGSDGTGSGTAGGAAPDGERPGGEQSSSGEQSNGGKQSSGGEQSKAGQQGTGPQDDGGDDRSGGGSGGAVPSGAAPSGDGTTSTDGTGSESGTAGGGTAGGSPAGGRTAGGGEVSGAGATAAERLGWGAPVRSDDFTEGTAGWNIYDGAGHAGNGRRTPDAITVADGVLTIAGDGEGNTGGMAWTEGSQKYGRWEGRVRAPESDPSYNALLLLWPTAENFPEGGEIDFMEMMDPSRQKTNMFLHYGADNSQIEGSVDVDATQWHNWAVEWTPERIVAFVDGEQWFETTDTSIFPPGPMHLAIQLDWFPKGGSVQESRMEVDWVRQYSLDGAPTGGAPGADTVSG